MLTLKELLGVLVTCCYLVNQDLSRIAKELRKNPIHDHKRRYAHIFPESGLRILKSAANNKPTKVSPATYTNHQKNVLAREDKLAIE